MVLQLKKVRSRSYSAETMTDAVYADDLMLLAKTLDQTEFLFHGQDTGGGFGIYLNENKTEYICLKQERIISPLRGKPQKIIDQFKYLISNITSIEMNVNIHFAKAWKSNLSNKIKRDFFQPEVVSILLHGFTSWMLKRNNNKKQDGNFTRMLCSVLNKSWNQHPIKQPL